MSEEIIATSIRTRRSKDKTFPVMEMFGPTIQGEGMMSGTITHFIRFGGCGYRCSWCDTMWAVEPDSVKKYGERLTIEEITNRMLEYNKNSPAPYVTLSGGDPCMYNLDGLIMPLNWGGLRVAIESQGQFFPEWLDTCDIVTISPKPPSSGNITPITPLRDWALTAFRRKQFKGKICIKVVCFDATDVDYALNVYSELTLPNHAPLYESFYFTAGTQLLTTNVTEGGKHIEPELLLPNEKLMRVLRAFHDLADFLPFHAGKRNILLNDRVHIGCQQHVLLWPNEDKGR